VKFSARWRVGLAHSVLLSMLAISGLASCNTAASEIESAPPPEPEAPAANPSPPLDSQEPLSRQLLAQGQILPVTAEVELNGELIGLEVAATPQQQAIGLMAREALPDDRGMLFPFEPARPVSFWMKNVLIPLDMVFIHEGEIVAIAEDVPPCETARCPTYGPGEQIVDCVLELRGGRAAELDLQAGDPVEIEWLESPETAEAAETAEE